MQLELDGINADSLVEMLKAAFTLENWDGILTIADKLYSEIDCIYTVNQKERELGLKVTRFNLRRSVVYYYGYSMCLKGIALQKQRRYDEALACIGKYSDLEWLNVTDAGSRKEIEYYREIAVANRYVIELNRGNTGVLESYLHFIQHHEDELLPGLITILESAIAHNYSIDLILAQFEARVSAMSDYYKTERNIRYYIDYIYLLSKYYSINDKFYDAIHTLLKSLSASVKLRDDTGFKKSVALFESLREHATSCQLKEYRSIMLQILD